MTLIKRLIPYTLFVAVDSHAELTPLAEQQLDAITGQSGITIEGNMNMTISDIAYQQRPDSSYFVLHDITSRYTYGATTLDITADGALRFGLPEFINFDRFSFSLYTSADAQVDTNAANSATYTLYAGTLGDAYDGFNLNISGVSLKNNGNSWNGNYINTNRLENNASDTFTIDGKTTISINLNSEDTCTGLFCDNEEDFAQITIVDKDGNIVSQSGSVGQHNATLNHTFESPVQNNFLVRATLTGNIKMGGAIEVLPGAAVTHKR